MFIDTKFVTICAAFAVAGSAFAMGSASADPVPEGCSIDHSVPNQVALICEPGAGAGQHAFIRCVDNGGLHHTRIGPTLGAEGGVSRAVCAPGESGPVRP
ncbi:hypothetical protein [Nocardia pseudobrasiliensis]|uniref:Secreted protein n=1 Tax=Nocardia pseudobrasiliensis TaxID=45979 RepID=A0A370IC93_9NOCA|nr:hypothetical protein [Nocardia pseudobrasiliensis]RDI68358.1 hypothetical protein DFR76_102759 [Nocardia pseudobrasiliensis]